MERDSVPLGARKVAMAVRVELCYQYIIYANLVLIA